MKKIITLLYLHLLIVSFAMAQPIKLETSGLRITLSETGKITELINSATGKNYCPENEPGPLLAIRIGNEWMGVTHASFNNTTNLLTLNYPGSKVTAMILVSQK